MKKGWIYLLLASMLPFPESTRKCYAKLDG